ncbi:MAG: copper amine oxidase N-terminal domain-containing protein [Thermoanaerobacterales bacterium]|nr:copper amine oxidase N-terminal domain-containing protein [Thermoanaerobacterales bacterium]
MRKWFTSILALVFILAPALPALAGPPSHSAVFVLNEKTYTVDGQMKTMDAVTFAENGRTYVPVRYLALACGVPQDKIGYANGQVTLTMPDSVIGDTVVKLWVGKRDLKINNEAKTMDVTVLARNGRTYLPARWVAQDGFGYKVDWVATKNAVLIYPPGAEPPAVIEPVPEPPGEVKEFEAEGSLKDRYPNDPYVKSGSLSRADYMVADLSDLPIKVGSTTVYKLSFAGPEPPIPDGRFYVEQSNPGAKEASLMFAKDGKIVEFSGDDLHNGGETHWTQKYFITVDTLQTADEVWVEGIDGYNSYILILPNPAKGRM